MLLKIVRATFVLGFILSTASVACQAVLGDGSARRLNEGSTSSAPSGPVRDGGVTNQPTVLSSDLVITIGDIDPEDPVKKLKRLQPLADYLAENLDGFGIEKGEVIIARDTDEMAQHLGEGVVDVYLDSLFPSLQVQEMAGSKVVARRWKQGSAEYWSTYVVRRDSGIDSLDDFAGRVLAFEEPHSTSGFILPAGTLADRGFNLTEVSRPEQKVASDEIGYFFSMDEENTFELVFRGMVAGGAVSNQDFDELDDEIKAELVAFERTMTVPRQFVSVRPDLDAELTQALVDLLAGLEHFERGQEILEGIKDTTRFDSPPPESETAIVEFRRLMDLVLD